MNRRVRKAEMLDAPVMDNVKQAIEAVVAKFVAAGVIDDKAFAQTKARALHRAAVDPAHPPQAANRQRRRRRAQPGDDGARPGTRHQPRPTRAAGGGGAGATAATGAYRLPEDRKDNRARDLATMARAGFAYDVAKKVIDAPSPDALDED